MKELQKQDIQELFNIVEDYKKGLLYTINIEKYCEGVMTEEVHSMIEQYIGEKISDEVCYIGISSNKEEHMYVVLRTLSQRYTGILSFHKSKSYNFFHNKAELRVRSFEYINIEEHKKLVDGYIPTLSYMDYLNSQKDDIPIKPLVFISCGGKAVTEQEHIFHRLRTEPLVSKEICNDPVGYDKNKVNIFIKEMDEVGYSVFIQRKEVRSPYGLTELNKLHNLMKRKNYTQIDIMEEDLQEFLRLNNISKETLL